MFHRVKSESPSAYGNNQSGARAPQDTPQVAHKTIPANQTFVQSAPAAPIGESQAARPTMTPAAPASGTKTNATSASPETFNTEKDSQAMNTYANNAQENEQNQDAATGRGLDIPGSVYQRAATTAPRNYPGAYAAGNSAPYMGTTAISGAGSDRRLTIGRGITLSGEIESCDYLMVEGTVEAALKGANVLEIADTGVFYGTVEINEATIAGRFEGDITVNGRLTVRSGGTITGTISYKELEVEAGAFIDGRITPASGAIEAKKSQPARGNNKQQAQAAMTKMKASQNAPQNYPLTGGKEQGQAGNDGELFSSGEAAA